MAVAGSLTYNTKIDKNGFDKGLKELENNTQSVGTKIKNIVMALGIDKIISATMNTIKSSISSAMDRIDTMNQFTRVMTVMTGSAEQADEALGSIKKTVTGTAYGLDVASKSTQKFVTSGMDLKKSTKQIQTWADAVAFYGDGTNATFEGVTDALAKMVAKGKVEMDQLNRLTDAGILAVQIYADSVGRSVTEVQDDLSKGKISTEQFLDGLDKAFNDGTNKFASITGVAQEAGRSWTATFDNFKAAVTRGMTNIINAIDDGLKSIGLKTMREMISEVGKIAEKTMNKITPLIKKGIKSLKDVYDWVKKNKELIRNLIIVVASLTVGYIAYQKTLVAIKAIKTAQNILGTVSAFLSLIPTIKSAKDAMLLFNMVCNINPVALVVAGVVALTTAFIAFSATQGSVKKSMENVASGFKDFYDGINNANSHLESFNSTLFASSEEQQKLQEEMSEVQSGITNICRTASDERRDYTQEEITQLDEYFNKLRELKNRELEIQKSISGAIIQQAQQEAQTFQGTLEEYKVKSQEWIKTAEEQKDKQISIINERTTQEIALLQQKYGEKATLDNEEYARQYNTIQENKEKAIQEANDEVAKVNLAYSNGYLERVKQEDGFYSKLTEANQKIESENSRYAEAVKATKESEVFSEGEKNLELLKSKSNHNDKVQKIWKEMYKNMSDEQANEMGVWLQMVAQTELHGGEISTETQEMVDTILKSYDEMPDGAKNKMKETMSGMLKGMQDDEPSLYAKASGIAGGILERLKKSFDIHSPSKKTRKIFNYVMEGAELGLEDEKNSLMKQIDDITDTVYRKMKNAVAMENASISAKATLEANKTNPIIIARDQTTTINNTQQFYSKESTPYEEQKQAKQQLRRLAYGL